MGMGDLDVVTKHPVISHLEVGNPCLGRFLRLEGRHRVVDGVDVERAGAGLCGLPDGHGAEQGGPALPGPPVPRAQGMGGRRAQRPRPDQHQRRRWISTVRKGRAAQGRFGAGVPRLRLQQPAAQVLKRILTI